VPASHGSYRDHETSPVRIPAMRTLRNRPIGRQHAFCTVPSRPGWAFDRFGPPPATCIHQTRSARPVSFPTDAWTATRSCCSREQPPSSRPCKVRFRPRLRAARLSSVRRVLLAQGTVARVHVVQASRHRVTERCCPEESFLKVGVHLSSLRGSARHTAVIPANREDRAPPTPLRRLSGDPRILGLTSRVELVQCEQSSENSDLTTGGRWTT
jgi:hypothetical protein